MPSRIKPCTGRSHRTCQSRKAGWIAHSIWETWRNGFGASLASTATSSSVGSLGYVLPRNFWWWWCSDLTITQEFSEGWNGVTLQLPSSPFCFRVPFQSCVPCSVRVSTEIIVHANSPCFVFCRRMTEHTEIPCWGAVWVPFFTWQSTSKPAQIPAEQKFLSLRV